MKAALIVTFIFSISSPFLLVNSQIASHSRLENKEDTAIGKSQIWANETHNKNARGFLKFIKLVDKANHVKVIPLGVLLHKAISNFVHSSHPTSTIRPVNNLMTEKPAGNNYTTNDMVTTTTPNNEVATPCYLNNDFIIAIDSSGSVGSNYGTVLRFAADLATTWRINRGNRVGILIFSERTELLFGLEQSSTMTLSQIENSILGAPFHITGQRFDLALDAVTDEFVKSSPDDVQKRLVFITDGAFSLMATSLAANRLYGIPGVRGVSIGIGSDVDMQEILAICGDEPKNVFWVSHFNNLQQILGPVSAAACGYDN